MAYRPVRLPLKDLNWQEFADLLWKAHAVLGRFDQMVRSVPYSTEVFSPLLHKELLSSHPSEKKVIRYQKALHAATLGAKKPFTLSLLRKMHRLLKEGAAPSKDVGRFRSRQNWIGPEGGSIKEAYFLPPKFNDVPRYMDNLKQYLNSREKDPLVQLSIFFAQLLIIHPFMDGNGRLARALIPMILCKKKVISAPLFFMSAYFNNYRLKYFEKLFAISEKNDWEGWIRFFLEGVIEVGEKNLKKMSSILKNRAH
jgi:Fic family protein